MPTLKNLEGYFARTAKRRDEAVAKFKSELDKNPVHALIWATEVMQEVARGAIADHYLEGIRAWRDAKAADALGESQPQDEDAAVEFIRKSVFQQAIQRNTYVERSTSPTSNFMKSEDGAFYAYLANEWEILS